MSLSSLLRDNKDVKERFKNEFPKPRLGEEIELLAPPKSKRYSLVGTAFDYLLRFYIERLNENAVTGEWVASFALTHPLSPILKNAVVDAETGEILSYERTRVTARVEKILADAKRNYKKYLSDGEITKELIKSCLSLAQVDPILRAGYVDPNLGELHKEDVADLRNLIDIVDPEDFISEDICLLNPTFGKATKLVRGADADLFIEGRIVEIKTTKNYKLKRSYLNQLIGYYTLHQIGSVGGLDPKPEVTGLGIYFSRHARLFEFDVKTVIQEVDFPAFINWFKQRAEKEFATSK